MSPFGFCTNVCDCGARAWAGLFTTITRVEGEERLRAERVCLIMATVICRAHGRTCLRHDEKSLAKGRGGGLWGDKECAILKWRTASIYVIEFLAFTMEVHTKYF
jgi:hypothetical protein